MPILINSKEAQEIRKLIPLATVPLSRFENICAKMTILNAETGEVLFKRGDLNPDLIYLLNGEVSLQAAEMQVEIINAKSCSGRFALAHQIPRKIDAVALTSVSYIRLSPELLAASQTNFDQEDKSYMLDNESEGNSDDWMTILLNSPIFKSLPPANLQKLLMSLHPVEAAKGQVIIKQGDLNDFYYLIKKGDCILSRKPSPNAREINLAQLRVGDTFGEDSLLSDQPINVSVTALTNVSLLRLDKEQFISLIKTPTIKYIEANELTNDLAGGAILLDVRLQDEFNTKHLKNSISAPFFSLRMQLQLKIFDKHKPIVVVCEDGKTSEAAAFLLLRNKFAAKILKDGLRSLTEEVLKEPLIFVRNAASSAQPVQAAGEKPVEANQAATVNEIDPELPKSNPTQLERLIAENTHLKDMVQKLTQQCENLRQEKELAEKQYRILFKQTDKLKEVLNKLKAT